MLATPNHAEQVTAAITVASITPVNPGGEQEEGENLLNAPEPPRR